MYIPAVNLYNKRIVKDDPFGDNNLSPYALGKRVIPVSHRSLYAYLQAIVLGLKGMKIDERAKEIIQYLGRLQGDFGGFREDFDLLGKHLNHAESSCQDAEKRLEHFGQKLVSADAEPFERSVPASPERKID